MLAWQEYLTLEAESPWSVLSKIAWLNHCDPAAFLRVFYGVAIERHGPGFNLADPRWLAEAAWLGGASTEPLLQGAPLLNTLAQRSVFAMIGHSAQVVTQLRTCSTCMRWGYHSLLHQLAGVERCHVHLIPLRWGCPSCGGETDYGVQPGGAAYGCQRCKGAGKWRAAWVPRFPEEFAAAERKAAAEVGGWFARVMQFPIWVEAGALFAGDEAEPSAAGARAWLAHQMDQASFDPAVFGSEPTGCGLHVYASAHGELLRPTPGGNRTSRVRFVLAVREGVEDVARQFVGCFATSHPCLVTAHQDFRVHHRDRDPYVVAEGSSCYVALGYYAWFRRAMRLLEEVDRANAAGMTGYVQGELDDVCQALTSELHRAVYAAWRASMDGACSAARLPHRLDRRARIVNRLLAHWSDPDGTEAVSPGHVRARLDYTVLISRAACAAAQCPRGAESGDGACTRPVDQAE